MTTPNPENDAWREHTTKKFETTQKYITYLKNTVKIEVKWNRRRQKRIEALEQELAKVLAIGFNLANKLGTENSKGEAYFLEQAMEVLKDRPESRNTLDD